MLFSQRYIRQIEQEQIGVDLIPIVRKKIWSWMDRYDAPVRIQPDPYDNYYCTSNILAKVEDELRKEHGWNDIIDVLSDHPEGGDAGLSSLVLDGPGHFVLDTIQLIHNWLADTKRDTFQQKINKIFDLHECQWRFCDGEFFKLDGDFIGARLAVTAHEALARNHFAGAAEEYAKSQRQLCSGEVKDAILYAGKSLESVLKVITNLENANANNLIEEMLNRGFFDDLPSEVRSGFAQNVMKSLPFLRNKLGGHGQGACVVEVPEIYGELTIQLAAALHNF